MSDTFWVSLFTFLTLLAKAAIDEWRAWIDREHKRRIARELHENTVATNKGNAQAVEEAKSAKEAALVAAEKSDSIERKADRIEERLNGGEAGLGARVAKSEVRLESLEKGQRIHDEAIGAVARSVDQLVINFASFAAEVKRSVTSAPAEIRGESGRRE